MSSNRDSMDCPHCGWEGAVYGNEGEWYDIEQCGLCGYNGASPGESLYNYAHKEVVNMGIDVGDEAYDSELNKVIDSYLDGEGATNRIPTKESIKKSKIKQEWFNIACQQNSSTVEGWVNWHDLEWCSLEELPIKIIEALFE